MRRVGCTVVGLLMAVLGTIFTLQGLGDLGGSAMSGKSMWAVIGPVIAVLGLLLIAYGWRRSPSKRSQPR